MFLIHLLSPGFGASQVAAAVVVLSENLRSPLHEYVIMVPRDLSDESSADALKKIGGSPHSRTAK